ncbi:DinB family protein [Runella zeae]|uniref:DinB family protein n=1 Tax=Runella zeae TaxID=94255 RepID=UPI00041D66D5|nr:DinB family protein [Runella zeae]
MEPKLLFFLCFVLLWKGANAQKSWSIEEKNLLVKQYIRTKSEVNSETASLTSAQWSFKEGPDKWSIAQVIEHLNMWSLLTQHDARYVIMLGENPELSNMVASDSVNTSFIYETNPHVSPDHTIPMGLVKDEANLKIFNSKYDEIIMAIEKSKLNFRKFVRPGINGRHRDLAQIYIVHYGHVDRHLRQIRRIKANPSFPK